LTSTAPHDSIIVPVLGETDAITKVLDHLRRLDRQEEAEILFVDGDPEGKTLQAVVRQDVQKILSPRGRGRQMNEGAKKARGEILLFLHADALGLIDDALCGPGIVGGAFDLGFPSARFAFKVIAAAACLRSRLTRIPFGDHALFFRRASFEQIGGFRENPLREDVELMGRIRRRGGSHHDRRQSVAYLSPAMGNGRALASHTPQLAAPRAYLLGVPLERAKLLALWIRRRSVLPSLTMRTTRGGVPCIVRIS
jgi:hypothetical protein